MAVADEADICLAAVTGAGVPLRLGRMRGIATAGQTAALIARDRDCSIPGCDTAPDWCERLHVIARADGGAIDPDNPTLLCRYHHHNSPAAAGSAGSTPTGCRSGDHPAGSTENNGP